MIARCPWCDYVDRLDVYGIVSHVRLKHRDMLATREIYHCPFCCRKLRGGYPGDYERHVPACTAYQAAMLSGCSLKNGE